MMIIDQILSELRVERDRLDRAINALEGSSNAPSTQRHGRRAMSAAAKKRISKAMKARWASGKMRGNLKKVK
jgi:hypothetical protein